jgi:hypothetical protein
MEDNKNIIEIGCRTVEVTEAEARQYGMFAEDALSLEEALAASGEDGNE